MKFAVVTGAGGFIGGHLVKRLKSEGYYVRGVDVKRPEFEPSVADEFEILDLRQWAACLEALRPTRDLRATPLLPCLNVQELYMLAADMGGMGFIANNHATILHNNSLISLHTLEAARVMSVGRVFYASSACVYNEDKQGRVDDPALKEEDAYPAMPQDAYGWEKLVTERLCQHYREDFGVETRVARFHNIMGPQGTWTGGREKAPAAICRKVAEAKILAEAFGSREGLVEVWGDGEQTRSFCYVDDCVEGIRRLVQSDVRHPINIGSSELISINNLVRLVAEIAGVKIDIKHVDGPMGVRGRNSDNTLCKESLGWEPPTRLRQSFERTYPWIEAQVRAARKVACR